MKLRIGFKVWGKRLLCCEGEPKVLQTNSSPGIRTLSFPKDPSIQARPIMENQMEKKMDNEMDNWSHKGAI